MERDRMECVKSRWGRMVSLLHNICQVTLLPFMIKQHQTTPQHHGSLFLDSGGTRVKQTFPTVNVVDAQKVDRRELQAQSGTIVLDLVNVGIDQRSFLLVPLRDGEVLLLV